MNSTLVINSSISTFYNPSLPYFNNSSSASTLRLPVRIFTRKSLNKLAIKAASNNHTPSSIKIPSISPLKTAAAAVIFAAAAFGNFPNMPAKAETSAPALTLSEELHEEASQQEQEMKQNSPLTNLLESSSEATEALKKLLQEKLEAREDEESLSILRKLSLAQPENTEWKFMLARVLNEMGKLQEARDAFEEILTKNPLYFEALFENALLMDKSGEGSAVMRRLEEALRIAENEMKVKEARDVKLIIAQMQFLHKNVEEAMRSYEELVQEDPSDFRPYFCKGMIYSLMDKNVEAREMFAKYKELSPKKFEVEGYLRTPLSRMKLFGTDNEN